MSRYKVLARRWWVVALCAVLIVVSTSIVSAFGVKLWLPVIAIYAGGIGLFFFARWKGVRHRARYCARCNRDIERYELRAKHGGAIGVVLCVDCWDKRCEDDDEEDGEAFAV